MAFISETKPRRANLTAFDPLGSIGSTVAALIQFRGCGGHGGYRGQAYFNNTNVQCWSSAIEVLNLNKPILLQDYFNTSNLQCWSSVVEVVVSTKSKQTSTTPTVLQYFRIKCWINATEVLVLELQGSASTTLFPRLSFFESASTFPAHMAVRDGLSPKY